MSTHPIDQQIKNWLTELSQHDLTDVRGLVSGLAEVLKLLAAKIPAGPKSAPIHGEGFVKKGGSDD